MRLALTIIIACTLTSINAQNDDYLDFEVNEEYEEFPEVMYQVVIDPLYRTQLSAEIQSPVKKIHKYMGEDFKEGDILIQLDDVVYQSNLKKAQAILDRANVEFEAKKQLYNDNVASLFELKEAEANVAVAEADIAIAERDLSATVVEAPYDGKVVSLDIEEYELTQPGKAIIEIIYDKTLLAKLLIPSTLLKEIKVGQTFTIEIQEENKSFSAIIKRIGAVIDPSSKTIRIEAEIDNSNNELRSGMTGRALFDVEQPNEKVLDKASTIVPSPVNDNLDESSLIDSSSPYNFQNENIPGEDSNVFDSLEEPSNLDSSDSNLFDSLEEPSNLGSSDSNLFDSLEEPSDLNSSDSNAFDSLEEPSDLESSDVPATPQPYAEEAADEDQLRVMDNNEDVPLIDKLDYGDDIEPLDNFFDEEDINTTSENFRIKESKESVAKPASEVESEPKKSKGWHFFN